MGIDIRYLNVVRITSPIKYIVKACNSVENEGNFKNQGQNILQIEIKLILAKVY